MIYRNLPFLPRSAFLIRWSASSKRRASVPIYIERERAIVYDGWKTDSRYPISSTVPASNRAGAGRAPPLGVVPSPVRVPGVALPCLILPIGRSPMLRWCRQAPAQLSTRRSLGIPVFFSGAMRAPYYRRSGRARWKSRNLP